MTRKKRNREHTANMKCTCHTNNSEAKRSSNVFFSLPSCGTCYGFFFFVQCSLFSVGARLCFLCIHVSSSVSSWKFSTSIVSALSNVSKPRLSVPPITDVGIVRFVSFACSPDSWKNAANLFFKKKKKQQFSDLLDNTPTYRPHVYT